MQGPNPLKSQISNIQDKLQRISVGGSEVASKKANSGNNSNKEEKVEKKKKKKLTSFTLRYVNEEINRKYAVEQECINKQNLTLTLIFQTIVNIIYMAIAVSSVQYQKEQVLCYAISAVLFTLLISFNYLIRKVASMNLFLFILLLMYIVITNVVGKANSSDSSSSTTGTDSGDIRRIDISFLQICLMMRVFDCWMFRSILLFTTVIVEYSINSDLFARDKIPLLAILPACFIILYINERNKKLLFYDYFYQQKTLSASQKLLDYTLPCSVIVLSSDDSYSNSYGIGGGEINTVQALQQKTSQMFMENLTTKDILQGPQTLVSAKRFSQSSQHKQSPSKPSKSKAGTTKKSQQLPQLQIAKDRSHLQQQQQQQAKKTLKFELNENNNTNEDQENENNAQAITSINFNVVQVNHEDLHVKPREENEAQASDNLQLGTFNPIPMKQLNTVATNMNSNSIFNTNNNIQQTTNNQLQNNSQNIIVEPLYTNNNNNNNTNVNVNRIHSKKTSFMKEPSEKQLKVNFINNTCLNTFQIQRKQNPDEKSVREYIGRTDFQEPEELQEEALKLLSQIEVQTSEYNIQTMSKSAAGGQLQQFGKQHNNISQFILANSGFNIQGYDQSECNYTSGLGNSKKVLVSTSLLDIVKQKYSLLHQKYIQSIYSDYGQTPDKSKNKSEKSIHHKFKNIDLEKEDVFVNCIYKNQKNAKALDIHIVEFQWIDEPAIMIVMNDISQQVRARRLQDLDSYKNELLATVTHDLKTPLNGMLSILEVAQELQDIDEIKNFISIVHRNGILLNFLIMDILDYSAMIKGEMRLIKQKFDIRDVLKDIHDLIGFQAQQKSLKFGIQNYLEQGDCILENDGRRIKQILLNLTSNALKFTFQGEIVIILQKEVLTDDLIKITVKDTGVGIPDTLKPKLFKLYGTYDHNKGSNKHGVGLGLVITKKLASQVGPKDTLGFQSIEKVGTEFSFHIYKNLMNKDFKRYTTFDSPLNLSKGGGVKLHALNSQMSLNPLEKQNSDVDNYQSSKRDKQVANEKDSFIFENINNQMTNYGQSATPSNLQNQDMITPFLSLRQSDLKNPELMTINTQENLETNAPFISPRKIPSHHILSPGLQKLKHSQFMQYQSTNVIIGGRGDTDVKLSSSRQMIDDLNKNPNIVSCVKVTESFDGRDNNNDIHLEPSIENRQKGNSSDINLDDLDVDSEEQKPKRNNHQQCSSTSIYDGESNYNNQRIQINQKRKAMSTSNQSNYLDIREFLDGEMKNVPRNIQNKGNNLELIQTTTVFQFNIPTRVLIVDDTYFNIIALKLMLKGIKNLIIEEAYNGQQAFEILNKSKQEFQNGQISSKDVFKIVFMDINMPIMDGIECTINIRKDPFYSDMKIIAVTAYSAASESQKCFDAGMDAHICKPISKNDCLSVLLNLNSQ